MQNQESQTKINLVYQSDFSHLTFGERFKVAWSLLWTKKANIRSKEMSASNAATTATFSDAGCTIVATSEATGAEITEEMKEIEELKKRLEAEVNKWEALLEEDDANCNANELSIVDLEAIANNEEASPMERLLASTAAFHRARAVALTKTFLG